MKRYLIGIPLLLAAWTACALISLHPHRPSDWQGWAILLLGGFPLWLALEGAGGALFNEKLGRRLSGKRSSWKRIAYALMIILLFLSFYVAAWHWFGPIIQPHFT
ncbi:MAG: hypothetical protein AB1921_13060 [Thermodesulfobacteriota bacterium]